MAKHVSAECERSAYLFHVNPAGYFFQWAFHCAAYSEAFILAVCFREPGAITTWCLFIARSSMAKKAHRRSIGLIFHWNRKKHTHTHTACQRPRPSAVIFQFILTQLQNSRRRVKLQHVGGFSFNHLTVKLKKPSSLSAANYLLIIIRCDLFLSNYDRWPPTDVSAACVCARFTRVVWTQVGGWMRLVRFKGDAVLREAMIDL